MKDVNTNKLAVPRERGVPRTDHDKSGKVPQASADTNHCSAFPPQIGVFEVIMENAWVGGVTVL